MKRFSRENIDKNLKFLDSTSPIEPVKEIIGFLVDVSPYLGFVLGFILLAVTDNFFFVFWCLLFGTLSIFFFYINVISFDNFKINNYEIEIPGLKKQFQFIFVTDLHIGKERTATKSNKVRKLVNFINSSGMDTVILGGDFVYKEIDEKLLLELGKINLKNKIAVYGNHDSAYLKERQTEEYPEEFFKIFRRTGFQLLNNEAVEIHDIILGGIPDLYSKNFDIEKAFKGFEKSVEPKILLSHNPDIIDFMENEDNIDLVMSGHNHAGQINLPMIGPLLPMPGKHKWMQKGLYKLEQTKLFMSQGFGSGGARTRIGTDAEVCIIKLIPSV